MHKKTKIIATALSIPIFIFLVYLIINASVFISEIYQNQFIYGNVSIYAIMGHSQLNCVISLLFNMIAVDMLLWFGKALSNKNASAKRMFYIESAWLIVSVLVCTVIYIMIAKGNLTNSYSALSFSFILVGMSVGIVFIDLIAILVRQSTITKQNAQCKAAQAGGNEAQN